MGRHIDLHGRGLRDIDAGMKITTSTGMTLDTKGGWAEDATKHAKSIGLKNTQVVMSESPNGAKTYLILRDGRPFYENTSYEAIVVKLDIMRMLEKTKE